MIIRSQPVENRIDKFLIFVSEMKILKYNQLIRLVIKDEYRLSELIKTFIID